jgi:hypothetical protein
MVATLWRFKSSLHESGHIVSWAPCQASGAAGVRRRDGLNVCATALTIGVLMESGRYNEDIVTGLGWGEEGVR